MARPATTDATRIKRTASRASELARAVEYALELDHAHRNGSGMADGTNYCERAEAWAEVATLAGNVQRDTRILAGLGRGG
jgi:hypothetical protein